MMGSPIECKMQPVGASAAILDFRELRKRTLNIYLLILTLYRDKTRA